MAKPNEAELDKLKAEHDILLAFVRKTRDWALYHDHGLKLQAIAVLKAVGEDA